MLDNAGCSIGRPNGYKFSLYIQTKEGNPHLVESSKVSDFDESSLAKIHIDNGELPISGIDGTDLSGILSEVTNGNWKPVRVDSDLYIQSGEHIATYQVYFDLHKARIDECELSFQVGEQYSKNEISDMMESVGCVQYRRTTPSMITPMYDDARLVDEELADQIWHDWDAGRISGYLAMGRWWRIIRNNEKASSQ